MEIPLDLKNKIDAVTIGKLIDKIEQYIEDPKGSRSAQINKILGPNGYRWCSRGRHITLDNWGKGQVHCPPHHNEQLREEAERRKNPDYIKRAMVQEGAHGNSNSSRSSEGEYSDKVKKYQEQLENLDSTDTYSIGETKSRREQILLRKIKINSLRAIGNTTTVADVEYAECFQDGELYPIALLEAAHIKPRTELTEEERKDPNCVVLMNRNEHKAYDTFKENSVLGESYKVYLKFN